MLLLVHPVRLCASLRRAIIYIVTFQSRVSKLSSEVSNFKPLQPSLACKKAFPIKLIDIFLHYQILRPSEVHRPINFCFSGAYWMPRIDMMRDSTNHIYSRLSATIAWRVPGCACHDRSSRQPWSVLPIVDK